MLRTAYIELAGMTTKKESFLGRKASGGALFEVLLLVCIEYIWLLAGGRQFVHCREVVHSSECPLSEVPLYIMLSA